MCIKCAGGKKHNEIKYYYRLKQILEAAQLYNNVGAKTWVDANIALWLVQLRQRCICASWNVQWKLSLYPDASWQQLMNVVCRKTTERTGDCGQIWDRAAADCTLHTHVVSANIFSLWVNKHWRLNLHKYCKAKIFFMFERFKRCFDCCITQQLSSIFFPPDDATCTCMYPPTRTHTRPLKRWRKRSSSSFTSVRAARHREHRRADSDSFTVPSFLEMIRCPESPSLDTQLHRNTVPGMNNDAAVWAPGLLRAAAAAQLTLREPVKAVSIYLVIGQQHPALNTNEHRHAYLHQYRCEHLSWLHSLLKHKPFVFPFTKAVLNFTLVLHIQPPLLQDTSMYW